LGVVQTLAGADDLDRAEPGDEDRDVAVPDAVDATGVGEGGEKSSP
jgi:hypothetical protein